MFKGLSEEEQKVVDAIFQLELLTIDFEKSEALQLRELAKTQRILLDEYKNISNKLSYENNQKQNLIEKLENDIEKANSIINDEEFRYIQEVIDEQYERKKYAQEILEIVKGEKNRAENG